MAFLSAGTFGAWRCATALMLAAIVIDKRCRRRGGLSLMIYLASRHLPGIWALSRCSHGPGGREQSLVARPLSQLSLKRTRCDGREADKAEFSGFCGETLIIFQSAKKKSSCACRGCSLQTQQLTPTIVFYHASAVASQSISFAVHQYSLALSEPLQIASHTSQSSR